MVGIDLGLNAVFEVLGRIAEVALDIVLRVAAHAFQSGGDVYKRQEEVRVGHELIAEVGQTAHALQHDPAVQVEGERPAHHLAVDQLFQFYSDDRCV